MTKFYKELNDEELAQEIEFLEAIIRSDNKSPTESFGFHEVLKIYREELELREKLSQ